MREKILDVLEKNGRIDLKEMAIMLGYSEAEVANEIGISQAQVSRLEKSALTRMRKYV